MGTMSKAEQGRSRALLHIEKVSVSISVVAATPRKGEVARVARSGYPISERPLEGGFPYPLLNELYAGEAEEEEDATMLCVRPQVAADEADDQGEDEESWSIPELEGASGEGFRQGTLDALLAASKLGIDVVDAINSLWQWSDPWADNEELLAIDVQTEMDAFFVGQRRKAIAKAVEEEEDAECLLDIDVQGEIDAFWASKGRGEGRGEEEEGEEEEGVECLLDINVQGELDALWASRGGESGPDRRRRRPRAEVQMEELRAFQRSRALSLGRRLASTPVHEGEALGASAEESWEERDPHDLSLGSCGGRASLQEELDALAEGRGSSGFIADESKLVRVVYDYSDSEDEEEDAGAGSSVLSLTTAESEVEEEDVVEAGCHKQSASAMARALGLASAVYSDDGVLLRIDESTMLRRREAVEEVERRRRQGPAGLTGSASLASTRDFQVAYFASLRAAKSLGSLATVL
ncbi:unnamed protein product [Parajaminaea phylloscopi]